MPAIALLANLQRADRVRKFLRIFLIIVVVLVGVGFLGIWWVKRTMSAAPEIPTVRVEPVSRGNLIETISAPGEVAFAAETPALVAHGLALPPEGRRWSGDTVTLHGPRTEAMMGDEALVPPYTAQR